MLGAHQPNSSGIFASNCPSAYSGNVAALSSQLDCVTSTTAYTVTNNASIERSPFATPAASSLSVDSDELRPAYLAPAHVAIRAEMPILTEYGHSNCSLHEPQGKKQHEKANLCDAKEECKGCTKEDCKGCAEEDCKGCAEEDCKGCAEEDCKGCAEEDCKGCAEEDCKGCAKEDCKGCNAKEDCKVCDAKEDCKGCDIKEDCKGCDIKEDCKGCDIKEYCKVCDAKEDCKVFDIKQECKLEEEEFKWDTSSFYSSKSQSTVTRRLISSSSHLKHESQHHPLAARECGLCKKVIIKGAFVVEGVINIDSSEDEEKDVKPASILGAEIIKNEVRSENRKGCLKASQTNDLAKQTKMINSTFTIPAIRADDCGEENDNQRKRLHSKKPLEVLDDISDNTEETLHRDSKQRTKSRRFVRKDRTEQKKLNLRQRHIGSHKERSVLPKLAPRPTIDEPPKKSAKTKSKTASEVSSEKKSSEIATLQELTVNELMEQAELVNCACGLAFVIDDSPISVQHIMLHDLGKLSCNTCDRSFGSSVKFQMHLMNH